MSAVVWLGVIVVVAQRRLHARRTASPASTPTYRQTGRPTIEDIALWRGVERDAREVTVAVLGSMVLVVTWGLVTVGVP